MRTMTLRAATVGAALALLAAPAHATETDGNGGAECDVMDMPGEPSATYLDEETHAPYLDEGNEWTSLTLTTDEGETEISDPTYGSPDEAYSAEDGGVITEITLCQAEEGAAEEAAGGSEDSTEEATASDDDSEGDDSDGDDSASTDSSDEAAGPSVETDGPLAESGPSMGLMGGAALAVAGLGLAGCSVLRRRDGQHTS